MFFLISFLAFWAFFLGSAFGSFLNVVVWRLPKGMSLSFPLSHCPKCGKPIRRRHNIPVLGWLILRGKCFDCRKPISRRYPTVEFLCGCAFLLIFWSVSPAVEAFFDSESVVEADTILAASVFSIMAAVSFLTIFAAVLIRRDGNRVPGKIFIPFWISSVAVWILLEFFPPQFFELLIVATLPAVAAVILLHDFGKNLPVTTAFLRFTFLVIFVVSCVWMHFLLAEMTAI